MWCDVNHVMLQQRMYKPLKKSVDINERGDIMNMVGYCPEK